MIGRRGAIMDPLKGQSGFDFIIVALALLTLLPIQWFTAHDVMAGEQGRNSKPLTVNLIEPAGHINNDYVVKLLKLALDRAGRPYVYKPLCSKFESYPVSQ